MFRPISMVMVAFLLVAGCGRTVIAPDPAFEARGTSQTASVAAGTTGGTTAGRGGAVRLPLISTAQAPVPLSIGSPMPLIDPTAEWYEIAEQAVSPDESRAIVGGPWQLVFEQGSVANTTMVTIQCQDDKVLDCELGPHGTQFARPVELRADYSGTRADPQSPAFDGSKPALFWLDDARGVWVEVPGVDDPAQKTYVVKLNHFSRYVLGGKAGW